MTNIYEWFFATVSKMLLMIPGASPFFVDILIEGIRKVVTKDQIDHLEAATKHLLACKLQEIARANPSSVLTAEVVNEICVLLGYPAAPSGVHADLAPLKPA